MLMVLPGKTRGRAPGLATKRPPAGYTRRMMGELAPGSQFAGHRIEAVAGRGGMGVVYRARQLSLDRTVALKVIAPGLMQDAAMRRRFVRESHVAASLDHPHVIPVFYAGEEHGVAYIAMRFVDGDDLRTLVRREGPLEPVRAARIVAEVADALDAAHAAGLVHRDVKPANVLLGARDHVYLTDFGLTKHVLSEPGAGVTREGHWVGTLDFVSPEQIRGERVDARSDVYGLGCLLFYVLAARPPFDRAGDEAKLWAHLSEPPPAVSDAAPGMPRTLDAVVARALAKSPEERYQSAGDLGRDAQAAVSGRRPPAPEHLVAVGAAAPIEMGTRTAAASPPAPPPERPRRRARTLAGAGLVALAAAAAVWLLTSGGGPAKHGSPPGRSRPSPAAEPRIQSARVGGRVNAVAGAGGVIWTGAFRSPRLKAVDPRKVERLANLTADIGRGLQALAPDRDTIWAIAGRDRRLAHFDARTGRPIGTPIPLPGPGNAVVADGTSVWVATSIQGRPGDEVLRFDARSGRLEKTIVVLDMVRRLVIADGALWILATHPARLVRLDLRSGKRIKRTFDADSSGDMTAGAGAIWATLPSTEQVVRLRFDNLRNPAYAAVGNSPAGVAVTERDVWVANRGSNTVTRIDIAALRPREEIEVPINPYEVIAYAGGVWVTSLADGLVTRIRPDAE